MADFAVHTLGCGSAKPTLRHLPSSTIIDFRNNLYMIDCGEGAQLQMMRQHLKFCRLGHIFLTHLHGDHVLGLPGLLSTLDLHGNGGEIIIHTIPEGEKILNPIIKSFAGFTDFKIIFNILNPEGDEVAMETKNLLVRTIKLSHRIPTLGYVFQEKPRLRTLDRATCDFYEIPISQFNNIKGGMDYSAPDGRIIPNHKLTLDPPPSLSYAHISDTAFEPSNADKIGPVDLLFHETTYLDIDLSLARPRGHSTASQAAEMARLCGAKWLLTGHYSSRYKSDNVFAEEARRIFPNTILNNEGLITDLTKLPPVR